MTRFGLPYAERLRSFGAVRRLFQSGHGGFIYPFRYILFAEPDEQFSVRVLFSVPKRNHKRANVRNLLRRRTKEAYRLNKEIIHGCGKNISADVALIYSSKEICDYKTIENAIKRILAAVVSDF
ncbi:MAG: ribonuclease P protein component [Alistipes sp.]|nr:ribonuclease P protein component [Alistipes sp.]